jgi:GT2 family glycosyltransferase
VDRQSIAAARILVVVDKPEDFPSYFDANPKLEVLFHSGSLCVKRNFAVRHSPESSEVLLFVDDDVELHCDYAVNSLACFRTESRLIAISGLALADRWMPRQDAIALCREAVPSIKSLRTTGRHWNLYGCNMAIRRYVLLEEQFDENLPLYSYGEDYEISIRLRRHGLVGRLNSCIFVHLRAPQGRLSRNRYVYSVVANNWYFIGKRSVHLPIPVAYLRLAWLIVELAWREARLGRSIDGASSGLKGVFRALADLVSGRLHPSRLNDV